MFCFFRVAFLTFFSFFFLIPLHALPTLAGSNKGLYEVTDSGLTPLWQNGEVQKIVYSSRWYILTSEGIFTSSDLQVFTPCNTGLPINIIKSFDGKNKTFVNRVQYLKDLEAHPQNPSILVTATKDAVFLSRDAGASWQNLGNMSSSPGIKAVAVGDFYNAETEKNELFVFMAHTVYGLSYYAPDAKTPKWVDITDGIETLETSRYTDEISDMVMISTTNEPGASTTELYFTQTYRPRLYRLDWNNKKGELLWSGQKPMETLDGLTFANGSLYFIRQFGYYSYNIESAELFYEVFPFNQVTEKFKSGERLMCASMPPPVPYMVTLGAETIPPVSPPLSLSELWLLQPDTLQNAYYSKIGEKKALYAPVHQIVNERGLKEYLDTMKKNGLNTLVIDMKDDQGLLKYQPRNPDIVKKAAVSRFNIKLDTFVPRMKAEGIYLIARIVVFKDRNLAEYDGGKYAIWDTKTQKPWMGIRSYSDEKDENGRRIPEYYEENWVDPYSEEVWEYNTAIANELIAGGFDEIQFDYIRFPTDGMNLGDAEYRWREKRMDKESALISFLAHARKTIAAPIGVDIYGANGMYRTGTRTGQDVELMSRYVDVISPMFYPSHFEQSFFAHKPAAERPYRIYYYGTYRNQVITRNQALVRPWLQAFFLNVSYDRTWYDEDYVQRQVFGVRDSVNSGYMYWNMSGRYSDVRPDINWETPYFGNAPESADTVKKPALGTQVK